jgi:hypothetical protein
MKTSQLGLVGLFSLVLVLAAGGCDDSGRTGGTGGAAGTSSGGGGGTTGSGGTGGGGSALAAAVASCNAWCDAYAAATCADPLYGTAAECKSTECSATGSESAACLAAIKALYDCSRTQANICADNGCVSQAGAAISACL